MNYQERLELEEERFKNKIKIVIFVLIFMMLIYFFIGFIFVSRTNAQAIRNDEIWMGWTSDEYGGMSYGAVANMSIDDTKLQVKGYGRYQFKSNTNLIEFMNYADKEYFAKWIEMGSGSDKLNSYEYGLPQAWTDYYANNKVQFAQKQDNYIYDNYYSIVAGYFNEAGIDIHSLSPYVKGAILSIVMYRYNQNEISQKISRTAVEDLISCYNAEEEKYINNIYDLILNKYSNQEKIVKRFSKEKNACLEHKDDAFDSKVGEILNKYGDTNSLTMIRELNNLNGTIFKDFLERDKFLSDTNNEWYDAMRNSGIDFKNELGISSGVLDFSTSTSHGLNMSNYLGLIEKEVVFKEVNNGTDIVYVPQNTSKSDYSDVKFGSNNVAQGGASLACLSMAINKLTNSSVNPKDIVYKIIEKYDDFNYFYDKENRGQKNEIIYEVANIYGLTCNNISDISVIQALNNGHIVIARVQKSEFTKNGTFILLCGIKEYNNKTYVIVADPNIYHARYLYNLYDIEYISKTCKGIFFDIR